MKKLLIIISILLLFNCSSEIEKYGNHYQKYRDFESLKIATELLPDDSDTIYVRKILGVPDVNLGFDYRYLTDSVGSKDCPMGAVFGIEDNGKIGWKEAFEICE